jgi:uncharacterized membrane protein
MPVDPALLASMPFFRSFGDEQRGALADALDVIHVPAGKPIFNVGDPGDAMYIVRSGEAETSITDDTGTRIVLDTVHPGDFFGEIALLHPGPRTATITVTSDLEALRLDRTDLERCLQLQPTVALDLLAVVGARLRDTNLRLRHTASRNTNVVEEEHTSMGARIADTVATTMGSWRFIIVQSTILVLWIVLNVVAFVEHWDPYPFILLNLALSFQSAYAAPIIMMSQNRQSARDRIKSDIEYDVNLKAELEIAYLHEKLDSMNADVLARLDTVQRRLGTGPDTVRADG